MVTDRIKNSLIYSAVLWSVLFSGIAAASMFNVKSDKTQLSIEEHLTLTFELIDSDVRLRAEGVNPNIDLALLGDAFVAGVPKAEHTYNIHRSRGRSTSSITVDIFPKKAGRFTIPAYEIDGNRSKPINIEVKALPSDSAPEMFVRNRVSYTRPAGQPEGTLYVNQQLVVYLDLFHRIKLESATRGDGLTLEPFKGNELDFQPLPQSERRQTEHGYEYEVLTLAWGIFQFKPGPLRVYLPDIWAVTVDGRRQRLPVQELNFNIIPLPEGVPKNIIVGKPSIHQKSETLQGTQYQASNWQVTLEAPMYNNSLPKQLPLPALKAELQLQPERAVSRTTLLHEGVNDIFDYNFSIIPLTAGSHALPSIKIPYFEPADAGIGSVTLTGPTLNVAAATLPTTGALSETTQKPSQAAEAPASSVTLWQSVAAITTALWLATLALWRREKGVVKSVEAAPPTTAIPATPQTDERPLERELLRALRCDTLEQGLQAWCRANPDDTRVSDTIKQIQAHYYSAAQGDEQNLKQAVKVSVDIISKQPIKQREAEESWQQRCLD